MSLTIDQMVSLVNLTQKELGRGRVVDLMSDLQEYVALPRLIRDNKITEESGTALQWRLVLEDNGSFRHSGLYETDSVNVADETAIAEVGWRHATANMAIERREIAVNRSPARIYELYKVRRAEMLQSTAEGMENDFWTKPTGSADDKKPYGVPYWIVPHDASATAATEGFLGQNPAGFNDVSGLDTSLDRFARFRNWSGEYTTYDRRNAGKTGMVEQIKKAMVFTKFKSPHGTLATYGDGMYKRELFSTYNVIDNLERIAEEQNDALGNDVLPMDGRVTIKRVPVTWVPWMEYNAYPDANGDAVTDPIVGIDFSVFKPVFLEGEFLRESPAKESATQHNTVVVHMDTTYNYKCVDRRRNFVLHKTT